VVGCHVPQCIKLAAAAEQAEGDMESAQKAMALFTVAEDFVNALAVLNKQVIRLEGR
jgi:hypothetical protein